MKIAQFRDNVRPQLISIFQEGHVSTTLPMYTRVSEWVEIEFPPLPREDHVPQQLQALDREEQELRAQLNRISDARASLGADTQP